MAERRGADDQLGHRAAARFAHPTHLACDLRDDRAVLSATSLSKGIYEYVYYARATAPGDFFVAPAHAAETYFPEVFGRSDSSRFVVTP